MATKRWSAVTRSLWSDSRFLDLSAPGPNAQTLWVYLLTNPYQGPIPGLFPVGVGTIADSLGWSLEDTREKLQEIKDAGMLFFCERPPLIFLPKAILHNQPANPNMIKGWLANWYELPECPLRDRALFSFRMNVKESLRESFEEIFRSELISACKRPISPENNRFVNRHPNQDQDQDQEQILSELTTPKPEKAEKKAPAPKPKITADEDALDIARWLQSRIATHSEVYAERVNEEKIRSWALIIGRLIRIDGAIPDEVRAVIQWAHVDDPKGFWQSNILGAAKLRKQYPRLLIQARRAGALQAALDEKAWKEEHGAWAIRIGQRAVATGGSFDGRTLIAAAKLERVPQLELQAAHRVAEWATGHL